MAPQRASPPPSGVVVGLLPKADALKKLEAERKLAGGDDRTRQSLMDSKATQKLGAMQRQIDMLKR